jgi:hypothetical protein
VRHLGDRGRAGAAVVVERVSERVLQCVEAKLLLGVRVLAL